MSTGWMDDTEAADYGGEDLFGEGDIDSESGDEESRASRRRRAQRIAAERRRKELARARTRDVARQATPSAPTQRETVAAIRDLDLETKVQQDTFRSAVTELKKAQYLSGLATASTIAINQGFQSFGRPGNGAVAAIVSAAPLGLLLTSPGIGKGFGRYLTNPGVVGALAVTGIAILGRNKNMFGGAKEIRILSVPTLTRAATFRFRGDVIDGNGKTIDKAVTWESDDTTIATVDATTGLVTAIGVGSAVITAKFEGITARVFLTVTLG